MGSYVGKLRHDRPGLERVGRAVDQSPFGRSVELAPEDCGLVDLIQDVPIAVEQSVRLAVRRRERDYDRDSGFFLTCVGDSIRSWKHEVDDIRERALRARETLRREKEVESLVSQLGRSRSRLSGLKNGSPDWRVANWYGLDSRSVWQSIYFFGLDLNQAATHILAVWLQGGHAVDWEGNFPDGRIVGYFFGGKPLAEGGG